MGPSELGIGGGRVVIAEKEYLGKSVEMESCC